MKTLADGTQVSTRSYYFLLDWNDENQREELNFLFQKDSLQQLTGQKFQQLYSYALKAELNSIPND